MRRTCRYDVNCFLFGAEHCTYNDHPERDRAMKAGASTTAAAAAPVPSSAAPGGSVTATVVASPPKRTLFVPDTVSSMASTGGAGAAASTGVTTRVEPHHYTTVAGPSASGPSHPQPALPPQLQHQEEEQQHHARRVVPELPLPVEELQAILTVAKRKAASVGRADPCTAWQDRGVLLVGPFARLLGQQDATTAMMLRRGAHDPPETEPCVITTTGEHAARYCFHRDDPTMLPTMLVRVVGDDFKFELEGNSVAALLASLTGDAELGAVAAAFRGLDKAAVKKRRTAACIAKTASGLGIVVPYDKKTELGYREPRLSATYIFTILDALNAGNIKPKQQQDLDEQVQFSDISNDECDFGLGLQLGLDFFTRVGPRAATNELCFRTLSVAYSLLGRDAFTTILHLHLAKLNAARP